ncbi:replication initiation protein [Caballeronia grimmiae]|uniref:replication initiation protein n=1 Tax=Caballeronia grimmiae TaxID=1071679 RepID=UPI0038BAEE83
MEKTKQAVAKKATEFDATSVERSSGDRWINMSNALTRAGHGLSLAEKRLVSAAVSKLDSRRVLKPGEVPVTKISAAEYAEAFDVDIHTAYDQLKASADALYNRSITFFEPAHKRSGKPLEPTMVKVRWVGKAKYHRTEGWIELHWWPEILVALTDIQGQFTQYQLRQASTLRSIYSWRLLELLTRFKSQGWAQYTIEDFAVSMDATEKQRADFAAIRRKMIEPAVKELQEKDGWKIEWKPIKAGRRVKGVRFEFQRDPQGRLDLSDDKSASND